jgi:hypothetical protein
MSFFSDPGTAEKYHRLGFSDDSFSLKIKIGDVSIDAVEHPLRGVVLMFQSVTVRTACMYEVSLPESCSVEQIASLIYVNIAENFRCNVPTCKAHFQKLGIPLFQ